MRAHPLAKRRRRLDLTQQKAADMGHMPVLVVVLLENEAKLEEYRKRYLATLAEIEKQQQDELAQVA